MGSVDGGEVVEVPEERGGEEDADGEEVPEERGGAEGADGEEEEGEEEEGEGEEEEVVARTPVARQRPRLQSHGTPAGGLMVDLPNRSGIVSR